MTWNDAKQAFETWRATLESLGVFVFQLQLGKGIRGFSMFDDLAPLIAVNTAENYQARSFTIFHELAHLGSRTDSACLESTGTRRLERWCEETASATLMPLTAIHDFVRSQASVSEDVDLVKKAASTFKVSLRAAAVALIRGGYLDQSVYEDIEESAPITDRLKGFGRGRGQRAPERRKAEVGPRPLRLVFKAFESHLLTERDLRDYLRLDGAELDELARQLESA
ncbi:MAG TPA: ImmA/IrrE family metallo-endopeptidase [Dehalococcoidia bacterium]|nr:ImmA/IrrE family metallo-endopeptidase [Dehalococcoidia bacterium]